MTAGHTDDGKVGRVEISEGAVDESRLVTPGKEIQALGV